MRSIDDYLDMAKEKQGVTSDTKLGKLIGISSPVMSGMRTRRNWPSDPTMVRIAELAGVDPAEALIDLSIWRNGSNGRVQLVWAELKKKLTPIAAMLCLFMGLSNALPHEAQARDALSVASISYGKYCRRIMRRWIFSRYQPVTM